MQLSVKKATMAGGISVGLVYLAMACWMNSMDKADIIGKTGMLLGGLSPAGMIIVTTLVGTVTGAFSGRLGNRVGEVVQKK